MAGAGLIGSKLVEKLREDGHESLAAAPETGVNTLTGAGRGSRRTHALAGEAEHLPLKLGASATRVTTSESS